MFVTHNGYNKWFTMVYDASCNKETSKDTTLSNKTAINHLDGIGFNLRHLNNILSYRTLTLSLIGRTVPTQTENKCGLARILMNCFGLLPQMEDPKTLSSVNDVSGRCKNKSYKKRINLLA